MHHSIEQLAPPRAKRGVAAYSWLSPQLSVTGRYPQWVPHGPPVRISRRLSSNTNKEKTESLMADRIRQVSRPEFNLARWPLV